MFIQQYVKEMEKNPDHFGNNIKKIYRDILLPIAEGKDPDYYLDERPAQRYAWMCSGDIQSVEQLEYILQKEKSPSNQTRIQQLASFVSHGGNAGIIRQPIGDDCGMPLVLDLYQKAYIEAKYGIKKRSDGYRRYTQTFLVVARKNGKTTLEESDVPYSLMSESGSQIFIAASTYKQAKKLFDGVVSMIERSPLLNYMFKHRENPWATIYFNKKALNGKVNTSEAEVLSSKTANQDGFNPSHGILDEVHNLEREQLDILVQGSSTRKEPLFDMITTAGYVRNGLFDDKYAMSMAILKGDPNASKTLLPIIYNQDDDLEWRNPMMWYKSNPTLGKIKQVSYIENLIATIPTDPNAKPTILTKDFNYIGISKGQWLSPDDIRQPNLYTRQDIVDMFESRNGKYFGKPVIGGFDLSKTGDVTCAGKLLFDNDNGVIIFDPMFWVTRDFLETTECKSSKVPWQAWIERGLVRLSNDDHEIDYHQISEYFYGEAVRHKYYMPKIGYDRYSAKFLVDEMDNYGFTKNECLVPVSQNFAGESQGIQKLFNLLKQKKLNYLDNPVMTWMLTNVQLVNGDNEGACRIDKKNLQRKNKIDGVSVLVDCLAVLCDNMVSFMPNVAVSEEGRK